ncbi:ABC transporter substrate-binding protein [Aliirhizobium smilacinae]|nr:ABC transporter substrate-binding protein [Rhizobium smilacinae]
MKAKFGFARLSMMGAMTALVLSGQAMAQEAFKVEPHMEAQASWVDKLPAAVKQRGVLNVGTTDGYAPWAFIDRKTNEASGADADLINEAAKRLGLTVKWNDIQFTAGIPGVESGRFDFYVSAMANTKVREEVVNFIAYSTEGSGVIVGKGNPQGIKEMADLCGKRVMIVTGSIFPKVIEELNKSCTTKINMLEAPDKTAPLLAVASGQADATMTTFGVSTYTFAVASEGVQTRLEVSPVPRFAPANQGIAFSKKTPELMAAVAGALQSMKEDGTYTKIMQKWSLGESDLDRVLLNAPIL